VGFTHEAQPKVFQTSTNSIARSLEIGHVDFTLGLGPQLHLSYVVACVAGKWWQKDGPAHSNQDKVLHDPNLESSA
jgi:hypothetical protein